MRTDRRWGGGAICCILVLGVIALPPSSATGADGDEEEAGSRIRPGLLHFNVTELSFELEASYERRRVGSQRRGTLTNRNRDTRFEQTINLRLDGDVIDPLFLAWEANLSLGLAQERFREKIGSSSQTDSSSGFLREFDIALEFLPEKPFSVTAYARRGRDRIPRRFLPSLLEDRREAGVTGLLRSDNWEAEFGFEWSDVDRTGNRSELDDESLKTKRFFIDSRWEISPTHTLSIAYDHQREESNYQGSPFDFDTKRDEFRVQHDLAFGDQNQHRLSTFFRYNEEDGDLARDETEFTPRLTLRHTDAFSTTYRYSYYRINQGQVDRKRHQVDVQALYRPDRHLRVTGEAFWLRDSFDNDVEIHQYGGSLDVSYRRPNPHGELLANIALHVDRERSVGDAEGGAVRGESHVLDTTRPTYLLEPDILRSTILAYNAGRTRVYVPGQDFVIQPAGRRTIVYRTLSGRIEDGELVSFDYRYRVPTGSRIDTYRVDLRLEHQFNSGWTPYYAFEIRRQNAHGSRGVPAFEDNTERHRFGLRLDRPTWSMMAEVELFDDSVEPYDRYEVGTRFPLIRSLDRTTDFHANASWFDFKGDFNQRRVWLVDLGISDRIQLNEYLSTTLSTIYRWEDDSFDGETNGLDAELGLHFQRGQLELDLTVEYDLLTVDDHDEGFGIWLTMRRDLSHLLPKADRIRS